MPIHKAIDTLDGLAARALLVDIECEGQTIYVLPPPMAGFFEFSMMRTLVIMAVRRSHFFRCGLFCLLLIGHAEDGVTQPLLERRVIAELFE